MKTIRLKKLILNNYKGQSRELSFGNIVEIRGENGQGKSTIFNALLWLVVGTDEYDRANFDLFDYFANFTPEDAATVCVCGVFDIDGIELTLKRTAKQKWERAKGSVEFVKATSDKYTYFVDDLEVSKSKYEDSITANFAPIDKLKFMLNHDYWALLDWKELRKHFMDIVGEISDEDFRGDYSEVINDIRQKGADDAKKMYHNLITDKDKGYSPVSERLKIEIETLQKNIPDLALCDAADTRIKELTDEREGIDKQILGMQGANDHLIAKRKLEEEYIIQKQAELKKAEAQHNAAQDSKLRELTDAVDNAKRSNNTMTQRRDMLENDIQDLEMRKKNAEARLDSLRQENRIINMRMFDGICPECGSQYEGAKRAEVLLRFTNKKEADREANIREGKSTLELIAYTNKQIDEKNKELEGINLVNVEDIEKAVYEYRKEMRPFDGGELKAEIERLEASRTEIPDNPQVIEMLIRKSEIDMLLKEQYEITALRKTYKDMEGEIVSRREQLNITLQAKADCERKEMLIQEYITEQSEIVRIRANKFFPENTEVVMMKRKKDGGFTPTCEIWYRGRNAYGTNTADRRETGKTVSEAFQQAYGVRMPAYIDNANDFDSKHIPTYEGQLFLAYVDDCELTLINKC